MEKFQNREKESVLEDFREGYYSYNKCFDLSDAGINQKIFSYWKAKGLVGFIEKGKWTKLSFSGLIWLRLLETMRQFGCSIELMQKIYHHYFTRAKEDHFYEKNIQAQIDDLITQKANFQEKEFSAKLNTLQLFLNREFRFKIENDYNYFTDLVMESLSYRTESGIIIFHDQSFVDYSICTDKKNEIESLLNSSKPRLIIPITHFITELVTRDEKFEFLGPSGLLNEDEVRVIREMRNKNAKSITITFKEKDHKIEKIQSDRQGIINGDKAKKVMEILGLKNYEGIELNTRDGKTLSFKHSNKKMY